MGELQTLLRLLRGNLTYRQAAELSGVSHNYIRILENGYYPRTGKVAMPSVDVLRRLAKAYNCSFDQLMSVAGYKDEHMCATCPIIAQANSGIQHDDSDQYLIREAQFNCDLCQNRYIFVRIVDDSMINARFRPGDLVVIELSNSLDDGKISLVSYDGERFLRRCFFVDGQWYLKAENDNYSPIIAHVSEITVIGIAVTLIATIK